MAAKRTASSDLNHENWDREDEPEESGTFQRADDESLKKRIIKTARRRNPISSVRENEDTEKKSAFAGFVGFSKAKTQNTFSFLSNMTSKPEQTKVNGFSEKSHTSVNTTDSGSTGKSNVIVPNVPTQENSEDYYSKLKGLNESVSKWIKQHVDANPFISLQPIFRDYEKYLKELENGKEAEENKSNETKNKEGTVSSMSNFVFKPVETVPDSTTGKIQENKNKNTSSSSKPQFSFGSTLASTTASARPSFGYKIQEDKNKDTSSSNNVQLSFASTLTSTTATSRPSFGYQTQDDKKNTSNSNNTQFSFASSPSNTAASKPSFGLENSATKSSFSFGASANATATTTSPSGAFSFGSSASTASIPSFSFSASAPISFGAAPTSNPVSSEETNKEEDAEDEPPKVEFTPVVEKDYLYTTRCKMFVKKEKEFTDRGVGNIYLKSIENSEKVQVILRADTNLGNLLCNFILSEGIPITRVGKKDVMLVCLPTADSKPPPVPVLFRVKSPEEADKLFETFTKHKK